MVKIIVENLDDIEHYTRVARDNDEIVVPCDLVTPSNILRLFLNYDKDRTQVFINSELFYLKNGWFFCKKGADEMQFDFLHPAFDLFMRARVQAPANGLVFRFKQGPERSGSGNPFVRFIEPEDGWVVSGFKKGGVLFK
jgi:hypothetical protein